MTENGPDPDSLRYARHWEPVLAAPARRLLSRIDTDPRTYLDVGAGTGALALAAAERWPRASVIGLDASAGMLSVARGRVTASEAGAAEERFRWLAADAAAMPLEGGSVDVATSSFMLQLVDDRQAVLREMGRVLRPGGFVGVVTWLADELELWADEAFVEALDELGIDDAEPPGFRPSRPSDYRTLAEARDELAVAGFTDIEVDADEIRYAWTRAAFLDFKWTYDERELVSSLDGPTSARLRSAFESHLAKLPDEALVIRGPLVSAVARRGAQLTP